MCIVDLPCCLFSIFADTMQGRCCCHVWSYRSHLTALTVIPTSPPLPLSVSFPGSQIYHSAVCILVQFLMLRLMGRTVTTVLCSFTFQMVRCPGVSSPLCIQAYFIALAPFIYFLPAVRLLLQWCRYCLSAQSHI